MKQSLQDKRVPYAKLSLLSQYLSNNHVVMYILMSSFFPKALLRNLIINSFQDKRVPSKIILFSLYLSINHVFMFYDYLFGVN